MKEKAEVQDDATFACCRLVVMMSRAMDKVEVVGDDAGGGWCWVWWRLKAEADVKMDSRGLQAQLGCGQMVMPARWQADILM